MRGVTEQSLFGLPLRPTTKAAAVVMGLIIWAFFALCCVFLGTYGA